MKFENGLLLNADTGGYKMQSEEIEVAKFPVKIEPTEMAISKSPELVPQDLKLVCTEDFKVPSKSNPDPDLPVPDSRTSSDTEEDPKNHAEAATEPKPATEDPQSCSSENIRAWLQRITQMQNEIQKKLQCEAAASKPPATTPQQSGSRVVKYQDLPYMGEMTLDNSKPRRGRKPKKADICHLIYKNYGTIFPGTPNAKSIVDRERKPQEDFNRSDVQNRIISSLLEKRLTQESKRNVKVKSEGQNEPLNLCIRDLDHLNIRMKGPQGVEVKSEPQSDDDVEFVHETPSPNKHFKFPIPPDGFSPPVEPGKTGENGVGPGGYVYWPNAGVFIHPMALQQQLLYYQKMAANNNYTIPTPDLQAKLPKQAKHRKLEGGGEEEPLGSPETKTKRNASGGDKTPAKRKRSAIFIPPIPPENQNNPATEVSICKFKFTGGAKPSLQEKKMLSVDSGGNFRYYSGTGDKSMRGYEFFPRETLQQQITSTQGSSTGAFLQASGEKIYPSSPVDFTGKVNDFMLTPELQSPTPSASEVRSKKRKSRKSLQREKLEQTFKEKGFLIQTQQLESAEGATYCKFRQLKKFTRYLFRSWKDHLPGNVAEGVEEKPDTSEQQEVESVSNLSGSGIEGDPSPPP